MTNEKQNISSSVWSMATNIGRVVVDDEKNSPTTPHDLLITWPRELNCQIKSLISLNPQSL